MDGISVVELIQKRSHLFNKQPILAGESGIHRLVTNVNVMEVPDIYEQVRVGDLLLTTGFSIKDNILAQEKLIIGLAERKITAIAIKRKRYIYTLPKKMLEHADLYQVPIIDLSMETNFSHVISEVLDEILSHKVRMMDQVHQSLQHLTQLLVMGESLKTFMENLSHYLNNKFSLLTFKGERISPIEGLEWPERGMLTGRQTRVQSYEGVKLYQQPNGEKNTYWIPIERNSECLGYLAFIQSDLQLSPSHVMILQHTVKLLALKITNQYGIYHVEERFKEIFLRKWILGEVTEKETILLQASSVGLSLSDRYVCILTSSIGEIPLQDHLLQNKTFVQQEILIVSIDQQLALLIPEKIYSNGSFSLPQLELILKDALHLKFIRLGISATKSIDQLHSAYRETKDTLNIYTAMEPNRSICYYEQLGIYHSLYGMANNEELILPLLQILKPLLKKDSKHNVDLLETISCYIYQSGNVKETAKLLYCHYNSVLYRLERIESILQLSVRDTENLFQLQLAIRFYDFIRKLDPELFSKTIQKLEL
jgi:purine catabolism regulator